MLPLLCVLIGVVALGIMLQFNPNFIPGVLDNQLHMETALTKTAAYNGATLDLGNSFAPKGVGQPLAGVVTVTAMNLVTGDEVYTFQLQESPDGGTTWVNCGVPLILSAAAASPLQAYSIPGFVSYEDVRISLTAVAGTSPSVTYNTDLVVMGVGA